MAVVQSVNLKKKILFCIYGCSSNCSAIVQNINLYLKKCHLYEFYYSCKNCKVHFKNLLELFQCSGIKISQHCTLVTMT